MRGEVVHTGAITYEALTATLEAAVAQLPRTDARLLVINVDHREGAPPGEAEMAAIKRFLRPPSLGKRAVVYWPETDLTRAKGIADAFIRIAGEAPIKLPVQIDGPPREMWQGIVKQTLEICNSVPDLGALGVDPERHDPANHSSIGKFMRELSKEFHERLNNLIESTTEPITLLVAFCTSQEEAGVLDRLTSSSRFGLLDAAALISATPASDVGTWWAARRGLLVSTIMRLSAHAFAVTPTASITALRQTGPEHLRTRLREQGLTAPGPQSVVLAFERSDLGKFLVSKNLSREDRGTPAVASKKAFQAIAKEPGFTKGADKSINSAMREALELFLSDKSVAIRKASAETKLDFCDVIPDNAFYLAESGVTCVEYTWRSADDFLGTANKSTVAQYILSKLQNYARSLKWTAD